MKYLSHSPGGIVINGRLGNGKLPTQCSPVGNKNERNLNEEGVLTALNDTVAVK